MIIRPEAPPIQGAPPYVVWTMGLTAIILGIAVICAVVALALWLSREARDRGQPAWLWLILGIVGGWVTLIIWLTIRDRLADPGLKAVDDLLAQKHGDAPPETHER